MRTEHFASCIGVFEGGGVRAVAYAGAHTAATNAGIRFNRVAGSSAGAIAAAFIAAGGTPTAIEAKLIEFDLGKLQGPPSIRNVPYPPAGFIASILTWLPSKQANDLGRFLRYSGGFSSDAVQQWVEESLREMLVASGGKRLNRPVRFSDLKMPLYVVAADVLQRVPKVWSLEATPDDSVSFAVQASCAIPFHFQPLLNPQSVFVDGGTICNLPSHVLPPRARHPGRFSEKTLAFRLISDPPRVRSKFSDAADYAFSIADTVVASATIIQQSLQDGIYSIEIDTGEVRSTDFDKMTKEKKTDLIASGRRAVEGFVEREREIVGRHRVTHDYTGFDERLLAYVFAISEAQETIWISDSSTYWLFFIYPIIAAALARGVSIKVMVQEPAPKNPEDEAKRRVSLRSLGCDVVEVSALAFTGLVIDYPGTRSIAVISSESGSVGQDFDYNGEQVRLYRSQNDLPVIRNLGNALANQIGVGGSGLVGSSNFRIVSLPPEELYEGLRRVSHYSHASFSIEEIAFDSTLRVSQTHIKEFKLLQIEVLIQELQRGGFDLFAPCKYQLSDGSSSIITPPILEFTPQGPVIIDGHTRAYYLSQLKHDRFRAIVVRNVRAALPVTPRLFSEMRVADGTMNASSMLPDYDKSLFRHIEAMLHP